MDGAPVTPAGAVPKLAPSRPRTPSVSPKLAMKEVEGRVCIVISPWCLIDCLSSISPFLCTQNVTDSAQSGASLSASPSPLRIIFSIFFLGSQLCTGIVWDEQARTTKIVLAKKKRVFIQPVTV